VRGEVFVAFWIALLLATALWSWWLSPSAYSTMPASLVVLPYVTTLLGA
jgi:hypothetical protein